MCSFAVLQIASGWKGGNFNKFKSFYFLISVASNEFIILVTSQLIFSSAAFPKWRMWEQILMDFV